MYVHSGSVSGCCCLCIFVLGKVGVRPRAEEENERRIAQAGNQTPQEEAHFANYLRVGRVDGHGKVLVMDLMLMDASISSKS